MSVNNLIRANSDEVAPWTNLFVNSIKTLVPITAESTFVDWTAFEPTAVSRITTASDIDTKYSRIENTVTVSADLDILASATSDNVILGNLPVPLGQLENAITPIYITEASDNLYGFGRIILDTLTSDQITIEYQDFEVGKWYNIKSVFSYGANSPP